jgi:hypothetical protein
MPDPTRKTSKEEALRRLSEAASPYGLTVIKTQYSELPELVLCRPAPDGREVAGLRYFEPDVGQPYMRSVIPAEGTATEQAAIERHIDERLAPVIGISSRSFCGYRWLTARDLWACRAEPAIPVTCSPSSSASSDNELTGTHSAARRCGEYPS